ncbi:MAG: LLM class flavin-dependent oxidoreductase, partial [Gaiellales bacterium]
TPYQMLQPAPLLGRLVPETGAMRLVAGIVLATLLNPVELAENAATVDILSGGRFVLGVGLGYRDEENHAFGIFERRIETMLGKVDVVRRLLEGEAVTAEGPGYRLDSQRLELRPVQKPRPPIWLAANNDAAVERAARHADTWLVNPHSTVDELERQVRLFRAARGSDADELPVIREVCVRATDDEAVAVARPFLDKKYQAYVDWGQSEVMPPTDSLRKEWDDLRRGRFLLGGPETVAAQIRRTVQRLEATEVVFRLQWPGMPPQEAMRSLTLLIDDVLPRLRGI